MTADSPADWMTTAQVPVVMTPDDWALVAAALQTFARQGEVDCLRLFGVIADAVEGAQPWLEGAQP